MKRISVVTAVVLGIFAVSCKSGQVTTNRDANVFQVSQKEKVSKNYHLRESQESIEKNNRNKNKINRKNEKFKRKQSKYLNRLNEYNRYKAQNKQVGAFNFY